MRRSTLLTVLLVLLFPMAYLADAQTRQQPRPAPAAEQPKQIRLPQQLQKHQPVPPRVRAALAVEEAPGLRGGDLTEYWQRTGPKGGASGAQPFGPSCVVDCTGATPEVEACGATSNDGCSVDSCGPIGFETITLGGAVCGNVYADDGVRDLDYYELTLTGTTTLTATIASELPVVLQLIEDPAGDCSDWFPLETAYSDATCTGVSFSRTVVAGTYYLMVGVADETTVYFEGFPCGSGSNGYRIDLTGASADCFPTCAGTATEAEACGTDTNGGCNTTPTPVFEAYTLGTTVCGTSRTFFNTATNAQNRDLDWYEFTVAATPGGNGLSEVTLDVSSEFPSLFTVGEAVCSGGAFYIFDDNFTVDCATNTATLILPDGNYYFIIGPGDEFGPIFDGVDCADPANEYQFTITATDALGSCLLTCVGDNTIEPCGGPEANFSCDPLIAETITIGTPFCTTAFAAGGTADLEYYDFNIPALADVTITVTSTLPMFGYLQDQDCINGPFLISLEPFNSSGCVPNSQTLSLAPGDYTLLMAPGSAVGLAFTQIFAGFPCGFDNDYQIDISTAPPGSSACTLACPPIGTILESEVCGAEDNDWCIATTQPAVPTTITIPTGICGTLKADGSRDFDFYHFNLTQTTDVAVTLAANLPARAVIRDPSNYPVCPATAPLFGPIIPASEVFAAPDCMPVTSGAVTLPPGDYVLWVTTGDANGPIFGGYPCGTANDYIAFVDLTGTSTCEIVTGTCVADCNTGDLVLDLEAQSALDSIDIAVNDENGTTVATATIPGPIAAMDMFTETFSGLPNGFYDIEITGNCPLGVDPVVSFCTVALLTWNDPDSVIFTTEGLGGNTLVTFGATGAIDALPQVSGYRGCVDSTAHLEAALQAAGETVLVIPGAVPLNAIPCITDNMSAGDLLWVVSGTYPNNGPILPGEGQTMVDLLLTGVSVYMEGGDVWGFDEPTPFFDYDGVAGNFAAGTTQPDGDDTFTAMIGSSLAPGLDTTVFGQVNYSQDSVNPAPFYEAGDDFTDQLAPAAFVGDPALDEAMVDGEAYEVWINFDDGIPDPTTPELQYATAIFHSTTNPAWTGGMVLVQSFEFGGFPLGQQNAIAAAYVTALRGSGGPVGEEFLRGDCNGDGATNIADAVRVLNVLFPQGCTPGVDCPTFDCADACDANDDGNNNIADAVAVLNVLFPQGCTPGVNCPVFPDPGNATCGVDPTTDMLPTCIYNSCP